MAVNKVVYGNTTVIDITDSTVTASNLKSGETAYGADGQKVTGTLVVPEVLEDLSDVVITTPQTAQEIYYDGTEWINYGAKILLTFDDDFRGQTITLTKGQTTITKTAPLIGNTMNLYVNETGTWTISSEISGDTYETEVNVTTFGTSFDAELSSVPPIPEGATVTPTDDIQIWLACANLDKSYTTLAEVLADRETFETLIADSNACDYMARSTTWAGVTGGLVPTMTSNTTPEGVASESSYASTYLAWMAFDNNSSTAWLAANNSVLPQFIGYEFETPIIVNAFKIKNRTDTTNVNAPQNFEIQATNEATWDNPVTLGSFENPNSTSGAEYTDVINNTIAYKKYRMYITTKYAGNNVIVSELQFYQTGITTSQDAMSLIGKYDYCSNALLGNATWVEVIANSDYWDSVLQPLVPTMTSATTPSGEAFCSSQNSSYPAWKAFDGVEGSPWESSTGASNQYIGYIFPQNVKIFKIGILPYGSQYSPKNIKIQAKVNDSWIDNGSYTCLDSRTWQYFNTEDFILSDSWRIFCTNNYGKGNIDVNELQFYGRSSSEVNIIHGPANDTIYTYEEGSPVTVATTNSDGDGILDFNSLEDKEYTFYSSVAKDPSNLSNDFSKTIRITKSEFGGTTEMYLMPDTIKTLYWWGYEDSNLEDCTSANGWSYSNYTMKTPTHNTNKLSLVGANGLYMCAISTKNILNSGITIHRIAEGVTASTHYGGMATSASKSMTFTNDITNQIDSSMKKVDYTLLTNGYPIEYVDATRAHDIYALWYE